MVLFGGFFAWLRGETLLEIHVTVVIGALIMFLLPRICAEIQHKRRYGVSLRGAFRRGEVENRDSDGQ